MLGLALGAAVYLAVMTVGVRFCLRANGVDVTAAQAFTAVLWPSVLMALGTFLGGFVGGLLGH